MVICDQNNYKQSALGIQRRRVTHFFVVVVEGRREKEDQEKL